MSLVSTLAPVADDLARVDELIRRRLDSDVALVRQVAEYLVASGGKRLRPALLLLACGVTAGDPSRLTEPKFSFRIWFSRTSTSPLRRSTRDVILVIVRITASTVGTAVFPDPFDADAILALSSVSASSVSPRRVENLANSLRNSFCWAACSALSAIDCIAWI
jgi:hypothetical protein